VCIVSLMLTLRRSEDRGHAQFGWLDSHHTFSFGDYVHPDHMGFRSLRVINEDRVVGGEGFPRHPHRDMEILSYVVEGGLAHQDSMGTGSVIRPGDVQRMTAGSGVSHSEQNASTKDTVHFLQIWIVPERRGLPPGYEQKTFADADKRNVLRPLASRSGEGGSITVHQDVALFGSLLSAGAKVEHALAPGRGAWVQVVRGEIRVNGQALRAGDGASIEGESLVAIEGVAQDSELLLFDLA
jgi:redox-sensitive bicupin YhaK (pirin superfamily)